MGVNSAIKLLGKTKKLADDVVEAGARNASKGNLIKNTTTQLSSNLTPNQMKTMQNAGREAVEAARNGARNASKEVISHNTTGRALGQVNSGRTVSFSVANSKNVGNSLPNNRRAAVAASRGQISYNTTNRAQQELAMAIDDNIPNTTGNAPRRRRAQNRSDEGFRPFGFQVSGVPYPEKDLNSIEQARYAASRQRTAPWSSRGTADSNTIHIGSADNLEFEGDIRQMGAALGKNQGSIIMPDTVKMDFSGNIDDIEGTTGTKFKTRTIRGNANRNTGPTPEEAADFEEAMSRIIDFDSETKVPTQFQGNINQINRTMGGPTKSFEIPGNTTSHPNTNYLNVNGAPNTPNTSYMNNQTLNPNNGSLSMNLLNNQSQTMQQNIGWNPQRYTQMNMNTFKDPFLTGQNFDPSKLRINDLDEAVKLAQDGRDPFGTGFDAKGAFSSVKNWASEYMLGGFTDTYKNMKNGQGFTDAVTKAFTDDDGNIRWGRAAGAYVTASAGLRLMSGGGLTRDRNGNPNMIGVPFI